MTLKEKSWFWYLTFPFAHANFTTLGDTLYCPKGRQPSDSVIKHNEVHSRQQKETGLVKFLLLYIFVLPFVYNPFRFKWELEAMLAGGRSREESIKILRSYKYGFLRFVS